MLTIPRPYLVYPVLAALSICVGLSVSMAPILAIVWLGLGIYVYLFNKVLLLFNIFLITAIGIGPGFNVDNQFGGFFSFADVTLFGFALAFAFQTPLRNVREVLLLKRIRYLLCMVVFAFMVGVVNGNGMDKMLQDLKLVLYFLIPLMYWLLQSKEERKRTRRSLLLTGILCGLIVTGQEIYTLSSIGFANMLKYDFSNRNIGVSVQLVPILSVLLTYLKSAGKLKMNPFLFTVLQSLFILACVISFTRTIWLQLVITYLVYYLLMIFFGKPEVVRRLVVGAAICLMGFWAFSQVTHSQAFAQFFQLVGARIDTFTNIVDNPDDTLQSRLDDTNALVAHFVDADLLWGKGLGDTFINAHGVVMTFAENSLFYYTWKYGLFCCLLFLAGMLGMMNQIIQRGSLLMQITCLSIVVYMVIGNFSGNLCLYYYMPILSYLFSFHSRNNLIQGE